MNEHKIKVELELTERQLAIIEKAGLHLNKPLTVEEFIENYAVIAAHHVLSFND